MGYHFNKSEFDIDVIKDSSGWHCDMYKVNRKVCSTTKSWPTKKEAEEDIIRVIVGTLAEADRPGDLNSIRWNPTQDRTGSFNSGSSFGTGSGYSHCDHNPDAVKKESGELKNSPYKIGDVFIVGATKSCIDPLPTKKDKGAKKRLIINCSGDKCGPFSSYVPEVKKPLERPFKLVPKGLEDVFSQEYRFLLPEKPPAPPLDYGDEVVVDWGDQKEPPLHPKFWADLFTWISSAEFQKKYDRVIFCCFGGHGRTGTALACLALAGGVFDDKGVTFKNDPKRVPTLAEKAEVWIQHLYCKNAIESDTQVEYIQFCGETLREPKKGGN